MKNKKVKIIKAPKKFSKLQTQENLLSISPNVSDGPQSTRSLTSRTPPPEDMLLPPIFQSKSSERRSSKIQELSSIYVVNKRMSRLLTEPQIENGNNSSPNRRSSKLMDLSSVYGKRLSRIMEPSRSPLPRLSIVKQIPIMQNCVTNYDQLKTMSNQIKILNASKQIKSQMMIFELDSIAIRHHSYFGYQFQEVDEQVEEKFQDLYDMIFINENYQYFVLKGLGELLRQIQQIYCTVLILCGDQIQNQIKSYLQPLFNLISWIKDFQFLLFDLSPLTGLFVNNKLQKISFVQSIEEIQLPRSGRASIVNLPRADLPAGVTFQIPLSNYIYSYRQIIIQKTDLNTLKNYMLKNINSPKFNIIFGPSNLEEILVNQNIDRTFILKSRVHALSIEQWLKNIKEQRDAEYIVQDELSKRKLKFDRFIREADLEKIDPALLRTNLIQNINPEQQTIVASFIERNQLQIRFINSLISKLKKFSKSSKIKPSQVIYDDLEYSIKLETQYIYFPAKGKG